MKTFDIALKYLKDIDFSKFNYFIDIEKSTPENKEIIKILHERKELFDDDVTNTQSNDYYRSMVFSSCAYHLIQLALKHISYWDVSCDIVEAHKDVLKTKFDKYRGTDYPKIMVEQFIQYCNDLNPIPNFLGEDSELRTEFFMSAFHYVIDKQS